MQGEGRGYGIMYEGGAIRDECRRGAGSVQGEGRGYCIMYEGGTIRDQCRVREEGMVLCTRGDEGREYGICTRGALSGISAG